MSTGTQAVTNQKPDIIVTKLKEDKSIEKPVNGKSHLKMRSITIKILPDKFESMKKHASELDMSIPNLTIDLVEGFLVKREKQNKKKPAKK
jgi:hypothetical protein